MHDEFGFVARHAKILRKLVALGGYFCPCNSLGRPDIRPVVLIMDCVRQFTRLELLEGRLTLGKEGTFVVAIRLGILQKRHGQERSYRALSF